MKRPIVEKHLPELVIGIKGAGEMASAVAWRLYMANMRKIFMMEVPHPLAVRRRVCFCEAVQEGTQTVEGIGAVLADSAGTIRSAWREDKIAVIVDPDWSVMAKLRPDVVVDAILAKQNLGTVIDDAALVIALGPGFTAGTDALMVVETKRGHNLGRIITTGCAQPDTGIPGNIGGHTHERVLRASERGIFDAEMDIGDTVKSGWAVGAVGRRKVRAQIDGIVRGLVRSGTKVKPYMKLGDIDPRGNAGYCTTISDKARAISGSVLEGVLRKFVRPAKAQTAAGHLHVGAEPEQSRPEINSLLSGILKGQMLAIARGINIVENQTEFCDSLLEVVSGHTGKAHRIGITGPPGAGKSTFTNQLIKLYRSSGATVGVVAVDPSSPFSGGAIFGDRLRMDDVSMDPGVYIRSMATRGNLGGLTRQAAEVADILDASGKDVIIFETVGVGQIELDVMSCADTIVIMTVPGAGDFIQGMKSGLMEVGNIFVVNKADLPGAEAMRADLELVIQMREPKGDWKHKVWLAQAKTGIGVDAVYEDIDAHLSYLKEQGGFHKKTLRRLE